MNLLIGPQSLFKMIYTTLSATFQTVFRMHGGFVDNDILFQLQWSSLSVVSSDRLKLSPSTPTVHSLKELDPESVLDYGEFSYYVTFIE
jgi:hypothetical protein